MLGIVNCIMASVAFNEEKIQDCIYFGAISLALIHAYQMIQEKEDKNP